MNLTFSVTVGDVKLESVPKEKPEDDRIQYLQIDEVEITIRDNRLHIEPKRWHIKEYKPSYCVECLKSNVRNADWVCSEQGTYWCMEHYVAKLRNERPSLICPKCDKGYLRFMTGDMQCSSCDHTEPHKHGPGPIMCSCGPVLHQINTVTGEPKSA